MILANQRNAIISLRTAFLLLIVVLLTASCATKRIISSWAVEEEYKVNEVLVVGVAHQESVRRLLEEIVVEELFDENITAIAAYSLDGVPGRVDLEAVQQAVEHTGSKAVLVMRKVREVEESGNQVAVGRYYETMDRVSFQPQLMPEPAHATYVRIEYTVEASLYDVRTHKKIWTAQSELTDPVSSKKYISQVTQLFIADLKTRGIL